MNSFLALSIDSFQVVDSYLQPEACSVDLKACIHCTRKEEVIATCYFYGDEIPLPQSHHDGKRFCLMFHESVLQDMLNRIEDPMPLLLSDIVTFKVSNDQALQLVHA